MNALQSTSDPRADAGLVALAVVIGASGLAANWPHRSPWLGIAGAVLGTLACFALMLRRSRPLPVALFAVTVAAFTPMAVAAAILAIASAGLALHLRVYALLGVYVFALIAIDVALALAHVAYAPSRLYALLPAIVGLGTGLVGRLQHARRETEERERLQQARLAERARIAREMHDVLAHRISMVSVHAGALEVHPDAPPEDVSHAASVIRASAHAALGELRQIVNLLRDPAADGSDDGDGPQHPQPTLTDLPRLIEEARTAGTPVSFELGVDHPEAVPSAPGRTVYRIVQEGLSNARKHAPGAPAEVAIVSDGTGALVVSIVTGPATANGASPTPPIPGSGTGLVGLAERVELAGGRMEHASTVDGGYRLQATVPLPA